MQDVSFQGSRSSYLHGGEVEEPLSQGYKG